MFCKNCGKKLEDDEKFCGDCGQKVVHHEPVGKEGTESKIAKPQKKVEENSETKSEGSGYKAFAVILVLVFAGFIIYSIWAASSVPAPFNPGSSTSTPSAANLQDNPSDQNSVAQKSQSVVTNSSGNLSPSLIAQIEPAVVEVNCYAADNSVVSMGSGASFYDSKSGTFYIESNYHVYGDAMVGTLSPTCYAVYPEPPNFSYNAYYGDYHLTLHGYHYNPNDYEDAVEFTLGAPYTAGSQLDSIPAINLLPQFKTKNCASVNVGDQVTIFGFPKAGNLLGISETVTTGIVSGVLPGPIYKTDAPIDHGNSGGLAILNNGECTLGIPTLGESGLTAGIGYIQSYSLASQSIQ